LLLLAVVGVVSQALSVPSLFRQSMGGGTISTSGGVKKTVSASNKGSGQVTKKSKVK
jgi:hypothetical protein